MPYAQSIARYALEAQQWALDGKEGGPGRVPPSFSSLPVTSPLWASDRVLWPRRWVTTRSTLKCPGDCAPINRHVPRQEAHAVGDQNRNCQTCADSCHCQPELHAPRLETAVTLACPAPCAGKPIITARLIREHSRHDLHVIPLSSKSGRVAGHTTTRRPAGVVVFAN